MSTAMLLTHLAAHTPTVTDFLTPSQNDVVDAADWCGAIIPALFLLAYTFGPARSKWWTNAGGQTIVALDICLLALFIPRAIGLAWPSIISEPWHLWLAVVATCAVPIIAGYRIFALLRHAHRRKVKQTGWFGKGGVRDND